MENVIKILFVDREQGEYLLIADVLAQVRHVRYQLTWCHQLTDAMALIMSSEYDVVLLDYYWGEFNTRDLLNTARLQACQTPIVVMTHEMETEVDREVIRAGASDYLIKDAIDAQLLDRTIRYAIERKQSELHLARLAHYDTLTEIPNRLLFRDRLEHAIRLAERDSTSFSLLFIDLNGFKQVNDTFGHDAGDALIRICAERLHDTIRKSDTVARMGGDEFTLLLQNINHTSDVAHIAQKVIEVLSAPAHINGYDVVVGCSIGVAIYPGAGQNADTLLKNADIAMYKAKQEEGSAFCFFTDAMNREVRRQLKLESDLRQALRKEQLFIQYQPRVDMHSGRIIALEAQLRWAHPERGVLNASEFMSIAEDTGLITAIGYRVIRQACSDLKKIHRLFGEEIVMSINLSVRQFKDDHLVQVISEIFTETGMGPGDIEFELTETTLMENIDMVSLCMRPLAVFGINFTLSNFGTGNSSFLHLQRLPISAVKIDAQFMAELQRSRNDRRLILAMINLAKNLGRIVIADGVDDAMQKDWLEKTGCDQMQGLYFYPPKSIDDIVELLQLNYQIA
ncbi:two-component system response regulator [Cellvibrio polysaccharolyticus]|uniref:EAL domain-containing protein n=1 Tax=Cellvibrio polysaccharolyticus TaxID=2082724 RepID=A0A928YS51_9GAMM|nr:EAL domain-containing protein [Cellvibrio polysaccharolyticus]MBE8716051.1 EAL domain-containing protein [Cellvibrio polysaccharolyticus]